MYFLTSYSNEQIRTELDRLGYDLYYHGQQLQSTNYFDHHYYTSTELYNWKKARWDALNAFAHAQYFISQLEQRHAVADSIQARQYSYSRNQNRGKRQYKVIKPGPFNKQNNQNITSARGTQPQGNKVLAIQNVKDEKVPSTSNENSTTKANEHIPMIPIDNIKVEKNSSFDMGRAVGNVKMEKDVDFNTAIQNIKVEMNTSLDGAPTAGRKRKNRSEKKKAKMAKLC